MSDEGQSTERHCPQSADSSGYQSDSAPYQCSEGDHVEIDAKQPGEPASEYRFGEARARRLSHFAENRVLDPRGGWLADRADGAGARGTNELPPPPPPPPRDRQVNFRLDYVRYGQLRRAARIYGTTPTGLARMLVNRGVESVLATYRAEMGDPVHGDREADEEDWGA